MRWVSSRYTKFLIFGKDRHLQVPNGYLPLVIELCDVAAVAIFITSITGVFPQLRTKAFNTSRWLSLLNWSVDLSSAPPIRISFPLGEGHVCV